MLGLLHLLVLHFRALDKCVTHAWGMLVQNVLLRQEEWQTSECGYIMT